MAERWIGLVPMKVWHRRCDFGAGANVDGKHYFGINWERDLPLPKVADLRKRGIV